MIYFLNRFFSSILIVVLDEESSADSRLASEHLNNANNTPINNSLTAFVADNSRGSSLTRPKSVDRHKIEYEHLIIFSPDF